MGKTQLLLTAPAIVESCQRQRKPQCGWEQARLNTFLGGQRLEAQHIAQRQVFLEIYKCIITKQLQKSGKICYGLCYLRV